MLPLVSSVRRGALAVLLAVSISACATAPGRDFSAGGGRDWQAEPSPQLRFEPLGEPKATIIALHGFNDFAYTFLPFGRAASEAGIRVIAIDLPGFGADPERGRWAGRTRMVEAARQSLLEARRLTPDRPVFLMGESMGGAVAILTAATAPDALDGLILSAPAVWGGDTLNPLFRFTLWLTASVAPDLELSGRGVRVSPSDNIPMLRALGSHPRYLRTTTAENLLGLVRTIDDALIVAPKLTLPRLVLIGDNDAVIPRQSFEAFLADQQTAFCDLLIYPDGYHILTRDLQRDVVIEDIIAWLDDTRPPSGLLEPCNAPAIG